MTSIEKPIFVLDVGPLQERHFTGIANVTRNLALELMANEEIETRFMIGRRWVPASLVKALSEEDRGEILGWYAATVPQPEAAWPPLGRRLIGVYPATKTVRRLFPLEVLIVHDLTTVIAPEYHTDEAVRHWNSHWLGDFATSDLIVAVSQSTMDDIETYYPQFDHIPKIVSHLAPSQMQIAATEASFTAAQESYVLVLGTIEPRKNLGVVFECIARDPGLLDLTKFIFLGRHGWNTSFAKLCEEYGLELAAQAGLISCLGFVSEEARNRFVANASVVVYPSRYEGFGMPIIEALSFGVPVISSFAASLPEVGGDHAIYFDPLNAEALGRALRQVLTTANDETQRRKRTDWAMHFSWSRFAGRITNAALEIWSNQDRV